MNESPHPSLIMSPLRILFLVISFLSLSIVLACCKSNNKEYSIDDQYHLARSRIDIMREQLDFSFTLDKETIKLGDPILFTAIFTNKINAPITIRVPNQLRVLDINNPNALLEYSITPLDKSVSLMTPLSYLVMPFLWVNPVQSSEFETLSPYATKDVKLEIPNTVYLQQQETWVESTLPAGKYLIHITYENLHIGYEIEKKGQAYYIDQSAWVGQIQAEPDTLTVLP